MPPARKKTTTKKTTPKKLTVEEILQKKKAVTKTVTIQLDGGIANQIELLEAELSRAEQADALVNAPDVAPGIRAQVEKLRKTANETEVEFVFRAMGREKWEKMLNAHPPTKKQQAAGNQFNVETMPPKTIYASLVEPEMTEEQVMGIWDDPAWSSTELLRLFLAAKGVNEETGDIPFSRPDSNMILDLLSNLGTQQNAASPIPST